MHHHPSVVATFSSSSGAEYMKSGCGADLPDTWDPQMLCSHGVMIPPTNTDDFLGMELPSFMDSSMASHCERQQVRCVACCWVSQPEVQAHRYPAGEWQLAITPQPRDISLRKWLQKSQSTQTSQRWPEQWRFGTFIYRFCLNFWLKLTHTKISGTFFVPQKLPRTAEERFQMPIRSICGAWRSFCIHEVIRKPLRPWDLLTQ